MKTVYQCEICDKNFKYEENARECEEAHDACSCKKESFRYVASQTICYGESQIARFNWKHRAIESYRITDGGKRGYESMSITHCPFCGEKLEGDNI